MSPTPKAEGEKSVDLEIEGYKTILRSLQAGVCRLDSNGIIVYANDTAALMLGREPDEMLGSGYNGILFGSAIGREDPKCGPVEFTLIEKEISHVNTENLLRKDSSEFLAELICVPAEDASGGSGAVISFVDVTNRRQIEREVSDARDKAVEAARAKADFLANMSHEIRTPLTGIVGTVDLLSGTSLDKDQKEFVSTLKHSTELLRFIVNEILDYSKIEAGKFDIRNEPFGLKEFAESVSGPFYPVASQKGLDFQTELDKDIPDYLKADVRSLQQVLNNLLSNALKFTESGGVVFQIRTGASADRLRFAVRDTGIGIPDSEQSKLFAPFEQADASDARHFEGTGLGLAISRRLVLLMGGEIGFDSKSGAGSEFWFEIPFLSAVRPSSKPNQIVENDRIADETGNPRILVVEDNPVNLSITEKMLKQIGIKPVLAKSGNEAISICREQDFDLILMDCQMPGTDGFAASRTIRENGVTASIIAFTASTGEEIDKKIADASMDGILLKPFTKKDILDAIEKHGRGFKRNKNLDLRDYFMEYSISKFIDSAILEHLSSLDTDPRGFLREILGVFADHFTERLVVLNTAFVNSERETIKSTAHNLRGSSANLGLSKIAGFLHTVENSVGDADLNELEELLHKITQEFGRIRIAIAELEERKT